MKRRAATAIGSRLLVAIVAIAAGGCAAGPAPVDRYYQIDAGAPDAPAANKLAGSLQVDRLRSDALTGERQLLYKETSDALEVFQHPYDRWSDPPPILIQTELVAYLSAASAADVVLSATARTKPDYVLTGRIQHLERVLEPKPQVVVEIHFALTSASGDAVLVNQTYREQRATANASVATSAVAFSEAVHAIFERLLADLGRS